MSYFVGVDLGTSSLKLILCDESGTVQGKGAAGYSTVRVAPNYAEQNPLDWLAALREALSQAIAAAGVAAAEISALAISTQGGTLVPVDTQGQPSSLAVVWSDTRCGDERGKILGQVSEQYIYETSGWHLGAGLNLLQVAWIQDHAPEVARSTAKYLSVPDYMALQLTGQPVLDVSNAGVNQLASFRDQNWDLRLVEAAGIEESQLGQIRQAGTVIETLSARAAEYLGLPATCQLVNGGHDQYCLAYGIGAVDAGSVFIGAGTAWVVGQIASSPEQGLANSMAVSRHVVPGLYGSMVSLESGGASLEWWRRLVAATGPMPTWEEIERQTPTDIDQLPLFLPYLQGNSYPVSAPGARAVAWGMAPGHDAWSLAGGVMAGVAMQTAWALEGFTVDAQSVTLVGGAVNSPLWCQYLANASNKEVRAVRGGMLGALGAAYLAIGTMNSPFVPGVPADADHYRPVDVEKWVARSQEFRTMSAMTANNDH